MAVQNLKSISYPFRKGPNGFPEPASGSQVVVEDVFALLETTDGEVPMGKGIGTRIHQFVNETAGSILAARVANEIRSVIRTKEPRMTIVAVTTKEKITRQGVVTTAILEFEVADTPGVLEAPIGTGTVT